MRYTLKIPQEWVLGSGAELAPRDNDALTLQDYAKILVFNHESGAIVSALPTFELMMVNAKLWMPKVLDVLSCCAVDPVLFPQILHISADDWHAWQQGKLETVPIDTVVSGLLIWEIMTFLYCSLGSWEVVSQLLTEKARLRRFDNKCPLRVMKSGDIRELARLQCFIAGEVLGSPYL